MRNHTRSYLKNDFSEKAVMPAKPEVGALGSGIQKSLQTLDSRLHGNDKKKQDNNKFVFEVTARLISNYESRITEFQQ